eukprot:Ihof_evm4s178 gene=Ihof_evmTU4s178
MDLSNKYLIKFQLEDDIRAVPVVNEDLTYEELCVMAQRLYQGRIKTEDSISFKYRDQDDDMVTLADTQDLSFAKTYCNRILRLKINITGKEGAEEVKVSVPTLHALKKQLAGLQSQLTAVVSMVEKAADANPISSMTAAVESSSVKPKHDVSEFDPHAHVPASSQGNDLNQPDNQLTSTAPQPNQDTVAPTSYLGSSDGSSLQGGEAANYYQGQTPYNPSTSYDTPAAPSSTSANRYTGPNQYSMPPTSSSTSSTSQYGPPPVTSAAASNQYSMPPPTTTSTATSGYGVPPITSSSSSTGQYGAPPPTSSPSTSSQYGAPPMAQYGSQAGARPGYAGSASKVPSYRSGSYQQQSTPSGFSAPPVPGQGYSTQQPTHQSPQSQNSQSGLYFS